MNDTLVGTRVRLIRCTDPHTRLEPGTAGTVTLVDSMGTVHVKWDNGSTLGMVADAGDVFHVIGGEGDPYVPR